MDADEKTPRKRGSVAGWCWVMWRRDNAQAMITVVKHPSEQLRRLLRSRPNTLPSACASGISKLLPRPGAAGSGSNALAKWAARPGTSSLAPTGV